MSIKSKNPKRKTVAYIRASTDRQDIDLQKLEILEYARKHELKVDDFIEVTVSSRRTTKQRRIDELMENSVTPAFLSLLNSPAWAGALPKSLPLLTNCCKKG